MATISAVLVPAKVLKGGRHKIRISVSHNGETRYIVTDIIVDSEKEFKNGAIVKRPDAAYLNTRLRGMLQRYQEELDRLAYTNGLTCAELVTSLKDGGDNRHRTIDSVFQEYISVRRIKPSTAYCYKEAWRRITNHVNKQTLVENIRQSTIMNLEKKFFSRGMKNGTIKGHLVLLKSILNFARRCGYVEFRVDPFANHTMPSGEPRDSWLTVEQIRRLRDAEFKKKSMRRCRDLILLSYYLGGINMADLVKIDFHACGDRLRYTRTKTELLPKTNKYVEFDIPAEAKPIIKRLIGDDGRIKASEYERKNVCKSFLSRGAGMLRESLDLPNLVYYSARKSFAQHALELGVKESVIDYILGHTLKKAGNTLYHYVYVTPEMATKAVRMVLDNLK